MTNIILCGGSGTRLWPISRTLMPKQFVKLFDDKSLFQLTIKRNSKLCENQLIVSNAEQYFLAIDQLEELGINNSKYLLEPIARNTAPAIALACFSLDVHELVLVCPSDHLIKNEKTYNQMIEKAKGFAKQDFLVSFGIKPTLPKTGFGYIETNEFDVEAFHEKPDEKTAIEYLKKGNFYWNSGIFMFKAGVFLDELKKHAKSIYDASLKAYENAKKEDIIRIKYEDMSLIDEDSIDYAVMEKSQKLKVIPSDIGWSDVGSFDSLSKELVRDENANTEDKNHIYIGSKNNFIHSSKRKIATIDIEDTIIVDTPDALLVSKKQSCQKVKQIVQKLAQQNSDLPNEHLTGYRPWGTYTILDEEKGYKIKRIVVKPGKRLSLQKHFHRNEHWIVISGLAEVTIDDKIFTLNPNESTYIKAGQVHRLENKGKLPLVIIEAQVGEYTGEDDIIRIEDDFKRD